MAPLATLVSFRLGGDDGVSVEARKWIWALGEIGFAVRRVAGELDGSPLPGDLVIPGLAIDPTSEARPTREDVSAALDGSDLVVVENLCSLPLNLAASNTVASALRAFPGRVLLRHHDLPWQRRALTKLEGEFPPRIDGALHVTVNLRSRREMEARGYPATVAIHNRFDFDSPPGDRDATRTAFGFSEEEVVVFQPARAIERKNVPGGVRFAGALAECFPDRPVRYWLSGPAEDGYGPTLDRVLERCPVPVTLGRARTSADAYAAADAVVFPSTWEGFGNPTVESITARRPLAAFPYPVLSEIVAFGLKFYDLDACAEVARAIASPDDTRLDVNLRRARAAFSIADLPAAIEEAFEAHGWTSW